MGILLDNLILFLQAIGGFITPWALFHVAWSTLLGIVIGALPGLTATSMYPKQAELAGITFTELVDRLIELALERDR